MEKDVDIDKLKSFGQIQPSTHDYQAKRTESVDVDYLRNILIKYLEYIATGEEKEAMTLEKVLFTVLNASSKDLESLQRARQRNNTGLLSYFYTPAQASVAKPVKVRKSIIKGIPEENRNDLSMEFE